MRMQFRMFLFLCFSYFNIIRLCITATSSFPRLRTWPATPSLSNCNLLLHACRIIFNLLYWKKKDNEAHTALLHNIRFIINSSRNFGDFEIIFLTRYFMNQVILAVKKKTNWVTLLMVKRMLIQYIISFKFQN
jgi:hypothetical protein